MANMKTYTYTYDKSQTRTKLNAIMILNATKALFARKHYVRSVKLNFPRKSN